MSDGELLRFVRRREPFVRTRRGDGKLLEDYFDGHRLISDPEILDHVARRLCNYAQEHGATYVAGETVAGSSLATAVSLSSLRSRGPYLEARGIRRVPKNYGIAGLLTTGVPAPGRFLVVDDVAGTGAALIRSVKTLTDLGHEAPAAAVILDREQGAREALLPYGLELYALMRLSELTGRKIPR